MDKQLSELLKALRAIAEGYSVETEGERYILVENPAYRPDSGEDPLLVIDIVEVIQLRALGRLKSCSPLDQLKV